MVAVAAMFPASFILSQVPCPVALPFVNLKGGEEPHSGYEELMESPIANEPAESIFPSALRYICGLSVILIPSSELEAGFQPT